MLLATRKSSEGGSKKELSTLNNQLSTVACLMRTADLLPLHNSSFILFTSDFREILLNSNF
jgi:hypothetical protein